MELVFYDTTTLHCEIDAEDAEGAEDATLRGSPLAGAKTYPALRQRGHSKNKRTDVPQVIVGLAMTRDGLPVRSWVFRGDTVDVTTVAQVKADLQGWKLTRSVFVGDAGMVSEANLRALAQGGGTYILCMPVKAGNEASEAVLSRPGRYRTVAPNLDVKEVVVGDGERRRATAARPPASGSRPSAQGVPPVGQSMDTGARVGPSPVLPHDQSRVALVDRSNPGNDLPDLLILENRPENRRHLLLWNPALDQVKESLIVAAILPAIVKHGWGPGHPTSTPGTMAARTAGLQIQFVSLLDRLFVPSKGVELLRRLLLIERDRSLRSLWL